MKRSVTVGTLIIFFAVVWFVANAVCLTRFPPMHADEAWLASETRSILEERSLRATADFFHITGRSPHAIRLLFHSLQAPFIAASWSLSSVRLLSLLCGAAAVVFVCMTARKIFTGAASAVLLTAGLALDPLFVTSSHLARPEIVLCLALTGAVALYFKRPLANLGNEVIIGTVIGLSIGLHANSLLVAFGVGSLYVADLALKPGRRTTLSRLAVVIGVSALWALIWIGASRLLSPDFPRAYAEFGAKYGVSESIIVKLLKFPAFYGRLFDGITGTYYLPPLRVTLLLFACTAAAGLMLLLIRVFTRRFDAAASLTGPFLMLIAVNFGLIVIGKYSQPSAVLLLPGGYWLASAVLNDLSANLRGSYPASTRRQSGRRFAATRFFVRAWPAALSLLLITAIGTITVRAALPRLSVRYERYLSRIVSHVPADARVLAGLNTAFAFDPGRLHAFNDLEALHKEGIPFSGYIERFDIEYILYADELDRIYAERPVWNDLCGNVALYYPQMKRFLTEHCEAVASYDEPVFAMRILIYQQRYASKLTIYRVIRPTGSAPG